MRKLILLICLFGAGLFGWNSLSETKPDWFLEAVAKAPFFDTEVNIDFNVERNWTEQSLQDEFDNLFLVCANEPSRLGDRTCWTYISKFNGVPANIIAFFFKNDRYHYLRVSSDAVNQGLIKRYLDNAYRYMGNTKESKEMFGQDLGVWYSSTGVISTFIEEPKGRDETLVTWLRR